MAHILKYIALLIKQVLDNNQFLYSSEGHMKDFGLVLFFCLASRSTIFSHVGTEPPLPEYLPVRWGA